MLATTAMAAMAGSAVLLSAGPVATAATGPSFGTATASPSTHLKDGQTVTVTVSKFGTDNSVNAVQCATAVETSFDEQSDCDVSTFKAAQPISNGAGSFPFTVVAGASYKDTDGNKCDYKNSCVIIVADGTTLANTTYVGAAGISFKDTRHSTTTKLTTHKKTVKAGHKVTFKATTHKSGSGTLSGKVYFYNGHKKVATEKEKASGKVSAKFSLKKGTHKVYAKYVGNTTFQGSSSKKLTVKAKK